MLATLVLATALAAAREVRTPTSPVEEPLWLAWAGLSTGLRTQTTGGTGEGWIALSRAVTEHLRPELDLGLGYAQGPAELLTSMRLGVNLEARLGNATPFAWLAFAHNHESGIESVKGDPLPALLGLSENGVVHRTGAEAGGGVRVALGGGAVVGLRAALLALLGDGPPLTVNGLGYLGYAF